MSVRRTRSGRGTLLGTKRSRSYSASADAARRATRAKDHLENKRAQQRRRRQRQRNSADRRRDRSPYRGIASLCLFLVALAAGIYSATPLNVNWQIPFQSRAIERVDVLGASVLTPESIVEAARIHAGQSLIDLDADEIALAIEAEPWIESARAMRLPTGALVVSVVERHAIAVWQVDTESVPRLVDRDGERFDGALEPGGALPMVSGDVGELESPLPAEAIEILMALEGFSNLTRDAQTLTLHLPSVDVSLATTKNDGQTGYVLQLGAEGPRALLGRRLLRERVARLAALVESGESTFLAARSIDLRYADRAVLRTEPVSG